ncbi:MAG: hypothetical protein R3F34_04575 [Planctomycetota bacterium]
MRAGPLVAGVVVLGVLAVGALYLLRPAPSGGTVGGAPRGSSPAVGGPGDVDLASSSGGAGASTDGAKGASGATPDGTSVDETASSRTTSGPSGDASNAEPEADREALLRAMHDREYGDRADREVARLAQEFELEDHQLPPLREALVEHFFREAEIDQLRRERASDAEIRRGTHEDEVRFRTELSRAFTPEQLDAYWSKYVVDREDD